MSMKQKNGYIGIQDMAWISRYTNTKQMNLTMIIMIRYNDCHIYLNGCCNKALYIYTYPKEA